MGYDTTVVSMAPCLLFAPRLEELHRGKRVVFRINSWDVAVDPQAADNLLALRALLADFINRSVGHRPTSVHMGVTDALSNLFSEHVECVDADIEDEGEASNRETQQEDEDSQAVLENELDQDRPIAAGDIVKGYWPEDDSWLPAKVLKVHANGSFTISWDSDESVSVVPTDYVQ